VSLLLPVVVVDVVAGCVSQVRECMPPRCIDLLRFQRETLSDRAKQRTWPIWNEVLVWGFVGRPHRANAHLAINLI
jgi:hypothetical protein